MVELGTAEYTYAVAEGWGKLPDGWSFKEAAAVGVDSKDNVYVFNRGEHPVIIFDREGNFLSSWGEGVFPRAHGVTMGPDDTIFLTDDGDHTMRHCTLDGKVLMTLGISGKPAPFMSGDPFNRCTHLAIDPSNGDFFISDGYGNARVHKYSPDGKLLLSWGADRENHRMQVFDRNGKFETQWINMAKPCGLFIDQSSELVYVGELGVAIGPNSQAYGLGPRVSIMDTKGNTLARLGDGPEGINPGQFTAPHGVCVDSHGDIYVGEVAWTHSRRYANPPDEIRSLQKLVSKG